MSDLFVFTFGPVQSFIAEARRGQDLFAGSRILSDLASAVLDALKSAGAKPVYPIPGAEMAHVPNKLVLTLDGKPSQEMGELASRTLREKWGSFVRAAHGEMAGWDPKTDLHLDSIWNRQVENVWECYWAAVPLAGKTYGDAYRDVSDLLDAAKRARSFQQCAEEGQKDTLSGRRSALRTAALEAKDYWKSVASQPHITRAQLRPDGRERLDALGCIKRFGVKLQAIPSVTTVASQDFLDDTLSKCPDALRSYRVEIKRLFDDTRYRTRLGNDWPYDGDLLYRETLTRDRIKENYGVDLSDSDLAHWRQALTNLIKAVKNKPSTYYGVLALDGDDMGKKIDACQTPDEHKGFSQKVSLFAAQAKPIIEKYHGYDVYIGGDDVLAMLPLSTAIDAARELAKAFREHTDNTASAGIAIAHVLHPLGRVLEEARQAERSAKQMDKNKAALAVHALKRSGEIVQVAAKWDHIAPLAEVVKAIQEDHLSSKFAYDLRMCAPAFTGAVIKDGFATEDEASEAFNAEMKRLLRRHTTKPEVWNADHLTGDLQSWAKAQRSAMSFADWMVLARFIAQRGEE